MAQRVLSISLGSEVVKVCEVKLAGKKKVQVFNAIDLVIPPGLCDDGVILDVDSLAATIRSGLAGEGFTAKKIVFTIASKRIASKEAIIPFCKENRIEQIVKINASEYFPIANLDEYSINYSILEVIKNDAVKNYRLSVVATPNSIIETYYVLAKAMGMSVVSIDYAGNSSLQLLKLQTAGNEIDAVLQMGSENTIVNIMHGATMVMQRSVPYGRAALVEAVEYSRGVPESVADLILSEEDISNLAMTSMEVADAVRSLFSSITRILDFYASRNTDAPIEHIYMIGDVLSINGLVELFNREWDREVEVVSALHGIEIKNHKHINHEIASNYIANIGALLEPLNISRIEEKSGKRKKESLPWWLLVFSSIVAISMCGAVLYIHYVTKNENDDLKRQIESFGELENLEEKFNMSQKSVQAAKDWYDTTKSANESLAKLFSDLEKVQPRGISINKISSSEGNLIIEGTSVSKTQIAEYVIQLKKLEYITDVRTEYITEKFEDNILEDTFSIAMTLRYDDPYAEETEEDIENSEDVIVDDYDSDATNMEGGAN